MNQADTVGLIVGSAAHDLCIWYEQHAHTGGKRTMLEEVKRNYELWCDLMKGRGDFANLNHQVQIRLAHLGYEVAGQDDVFVRGPHMEALTYTCAKASGMVEWGIGFQRPTVTT